MTIFFKGLSSYSLEMVELNSILKRTTDKTLVLGDEVCRGTEHISGNAIVATTLINLSNKKSSFIFATHLHEIVNIDEIKEKDDIKAFHLSVSYDKNTEELVYDRILKEGSGEQIYGIIVAKSIIHDNEFIDKAIEIKNRLLDTNNGFLGNKTSNYNKEKLVYKCEICGENRKQSFSNLESHHINFQKDFDKNNFHKTKKHIKKHAKYNLIIVCENVIIIFTMK